MDFTEVMRLLQNIIRTGTVLEVDSEKWRVRVSSGGLQTTWLRWNTQRAGAFNTWCAPSVGEQIWFLCIGGNPETAIIGGSLHSDDNPAPSASENEIVVKAPDGAQFRYDATEGALTITGVKTAKLEASVKVILDAPVVECTELLKTKNFTVSAGGNLEGNFEHTGGAFVSNGVRVDNHDHGGVERGNSWTDGVR